MKFIIDKYNKYVNNKNLEDINNKHIVLEKLIINVLLITFISREELNHYLDTKTLHLNNKSTVELQIEELINLNKDKKKMKSITIYYNNLRNKE